MQSFRNRRESDEASLDKCWTRIEGTGALLRGTSEVRQDLPTKRRHQPTLALFGLKQRNLGASGLHTASLMLQKKEVHFAVRHVAEQH